MHGGNINIQHIAKCFFFYIPRANGPILFPLELLLSNMSKFIKIFFIFFSRKIYYKSNYYSMAFENCIESWSSWPNIYHIFIFIACFNFMVKEKRKNEKTMETGDVTINIIINLWAFHKKIQHLRSINTR